MDYEGLETGDDSDQLSASFHRRPNDHGSSAPPPLHVAGRSERDGMQKKYLDMWRGFRIAAATA